MNRLLIMGLLGVLVVSGVGCAGLGGAPRYVNVSFMPDGRIRVAGKPVPASRFLAQVRRTGANEETEIRFDVPPAMQRNRMRTLVVQLNQGGYRKVLFMTPRRATADVDQP